MTPHERISVLDKHECWHRADSETMCHMLKLLMHTTAQNSTTLRNTIHTLEGHW